jgi:hypothetical protein
LPQSPVPILHNTNPHHTEPPIKTEQVGMFGEEGVRTKDR